MLFTWCMSLRIYPTTPGPSLATKRHPRDSRTFAPMSPRVLLIHGYDFFFYSKEENRKHIHVEKGDHEAKVWLEPMIEVAYNYGFSSREIKFILQIIERYEREIHERWSKHFGDAE